MTVIKIIGFCCLLLALLFPGCIKDERIRTYTFYRPVYKTSLEARAEIKSKDPIPLSHPGKLFYKDGYVFLNELNFGIHIIDVRNAYEPKLVSFIKIPGCVDMAVRGNILYSDMFTDLVAIDISNPFEVKLKKTLEGVFPDFPGIYYNGYRVTSNKLITDWIRVDTTVREKDNSNFLINMKRGPISLANSYMNSISSGIGGSMARFALNADRLYTVSDADLNIFNTSVPENPAFIKKLDLNRGFTIETIFPYANYLFIGSQNGMFIYDLSDKDIPAEKGRFNHAQVCDPVISDGDFAYVTLRNGTSCNGFINQLDVVSIKDISNPQLVSSYPMTNPHGLSKDGNTLLICEGADGLRVLDASVPDNIKTVGQLKGFTTFDVITIGGIALVSAADGLYLVDYSRPDQPVITGSIKITNR